MTDKPWHHTSVSSFGCHTALAANDLGILAALFRQAIINGRTMFLRSDRGNLTKPNEEALAEIQALATEHGLIKVMENRGSHIAGRQGHYSIGWVNGDSIVHFGYANNLKEHALGQVAVEAASPNEEMVKKFVAAAAWITQKETVQKGQVYALTSGAGGLSISQIGFAGLDLIPDNYTPEVLEGYENIKADILSATPMGRLAILEGEPGVGKTTLIRCLVHAIPSVKFVIMPVSLVSSLQGPEIQRCLLNEMENDNNENEASKRFVFIIEDADDILAVRETGNIGSLSTLLNVTDGITGALFDIRALCSTNAATEDLDPAITRSGRLSEHVKIGSLPYDQALKVFKRLTTDKPEAELKAKPFYTLAEVYAEAKLTGRAHGKKRERKSMGFGKGK